MIVDQASTTSATADRKTTGVDALDEVLGGGIPRGAIVFVTGLPGAGKTILSEQALFANARSSESVLYVTTLSEPAIKMLQFSQRFTFFRPDLMERNVHYADLGSALRAGGPSKALEMLDALIKRHRPDFLVLDSFKVFREHFDDVRSFRAFASELTLLIVTWEITCLLVGEYTFADIDVQPEFAIADGILHLAGTEEPTRQKRYLNIVKMRGSDSFLGRHYFEIDEAGVTLYPRMLPSVTADYPISQERLRSAIPGLSEMMGGGLPAGDSLLISGGTGTGKTLTAFSFAVSAARQGTPSLFVSLEESPSHLKANTANLGWDLESLVDAKTLQLMHFSPSELDIDRHAVVIQRAVEAMGAKVVVIDSITAFDPGSGEAGVVKHYLWGITDYFKRTGVSAIFTTEAYSIFESANYNTVRAVSYVADAIILLRLVEDGHRVSRRINVLKMRGSSHETALMDLRIEESGISIGKKR